MWLLKCHVEGKGEEDGSVVWTSNASIIQQRLKSRVFCQALPSWDSKHYIKKWETGQATVVLQKCLWCKISLLKIISLHCPRAYRSAFVHHGVECYLFSLRLMFNLYFHTQAYIQGLEHWDLTITANRIYSLFFTSQNSRWNIKLTSQTH